MALSLGRVEVLGVVTEPVVLLPRVVAPRLMRVPLSPLRLVLVLVLLWVTCGLVVLLLETLLERSTLGEVDALLLEMLLERSTCGVVAALRLTLGLALRLTDGDVELLLERETAAVWLLLLELPPCERPRPWAEASDAPMIRHPMSAKLIIIFVTEVFIIVLF
jgi:hypothetical protein